MTYDWRPTATRAATTDPGLVALQRRPTTAAGASGEPPLDAPASVPAEDSLVAAAIEEFIAAAEDGRALNRSGRPYRPSALRDLRGCLRHQVARDLGDLRLRDVRRRHVQALVDRLAADGLSESRIRSVVSALRALYGYAIEQGEVEFSPADGLVIPRDPEPVWAEDDASFDEDETARSWTDDVDEAWAEATRFRSERRRSYDAPRREREERSRPERYDSDYQPMALLPERILSLVLRIVIVVFVLFALATIAGSVGGA